MYLIEPIMMMRDLITQNVQQHEKDFYFVLLWFDDKPRLKYQLFEQILQQYRRLRSFDLRF